MVHPMRIWGHKHLRFVTHCHGRIAVFCSWDPDYSPRSACPPERSMTVSPLFLIGEVEKNTHGVIPRMANSILHQRRSTPGRFSIEPSVGAKNRHPTEWEIGPGRAGKVSRGCGDRPRCNVGLMLVILGTVVLRREAMRTGKNVCG